ncbi:MAG TPA: zinc ribbon domain-containing protein [Candidatus Sulfopaludibacter sp.]|jgi:hypothetical protein|nr:zinc ribbon domain-containing protein [Candidatus Sulfopaludibacter sp.]
MFCDRCGTKLHDQASFCPSCGKPARVVPLMPVQSRIGGHIRLLGILWLALSAFRLLPGMFLLSMFRHGGITFLPPEVPFFVHGILRVVGMALLFSGVIGIVAGWGLLERQPWARMLCIVMGCLNLIDMPFGTALGIYTLWVLLPARSEAEYRQIARAA